MADDGVLMSEIHSRSHVGTHADSPAHFIAEGATTFTIGVDRWMGDAWVARVPEATGPIEPGMLTLPPQPAHALLGAGVLIIENLNGLEAVGVGRCWFCAAPLLTGGGDGGFCRAFAAVPS